jgi:hypothetical protein
MGAPKPQPLAMAPKPPGSTIRLLKIVVLGAFAAGPVDFAVGQQAPPACGSAEHRTFDFWLGEWNVHGPKGLLAGTNSIRREYGGCVLHERYETGRGYSGESLNIYDETRRVWHQTWVDSSGMLLVLEGPIQIGRAHV